MYDTERAALERLDRLGGAELKRELVALYLEQSSERIDAARAAVSHGDAPALAGATHSIRSSSAQLGAQELVQRCESVESALDDGRFQDAAEELQRVVGAFHEFSAWVRVAAGVDDSHAPVTTSCADPQSVRPHRARTIAVIEDNVDNRLLLDAILGDLYQLNEYATGTEALAMMTTHTPALVLLDVSLPGMDGLDVLARIRSDPVLHDVPVIAVTAHAMAGDRERYLAAGFDGYVPKPIVDERVLIDTIEHLLISGDANDARAEADGT
jgi:CheY-like chemotaxis protein/HPt (histidine-containing phosphotransfer) domain-containing protein